MNDKSIEYKFEYPSMGTKWEISIWYNKPKSFFTNKKHKELLRKLDNLKETIINHTNDFDAKYSRFKSDSFITELSTKTGDFKVSEDLMNMLKLYKDLYVISEKTLNPLIGNTISDMGYDHKYTLKPKETIRKVPDFDKTIKFIDHETISIKEPVLIDLGALGKGYFVQKLAHFLFKELKDHEYDRFLVDGSGDFYYHSKGYEIRIGLEDPQDPTKVVGILKMDKGTLCSSAITRRHWGKYNHIINPKTLESTKEIIAAWVVSDNAALSDALATCVFFVEPEKLQEKYDFAYFLLYADYHAKYSENFNVELF